MNITETLNELTEKIWLTIPRRTHAIYDRLHKYGQECFSLGVKAINQYGFKWQDIATIITIWEEGLKTDEFTNIGESGLLEKQSKEILKKYKKLKEI